MNINNTIKGPTKSNQIARYIVEEISVESPIEAQLRNETSKLEASRMISSSDVGALLTLLVASVNAKNAIEIGTFTGYTALKIAKGLPEGGQLLCCDVSKEWTQIGKPFWQKAKVDTKINLQIAPAIETLTKLVTQGQSGCFDFAFIDADKIGYDSYYEICLKLLRPGGLIVLDNMLWGGSVADPSIQDETTLAIRNLNLKISKDPRVLSSLLSVGDGLMLAYKK